MPDPKNPIYNRVPRPVYVKGVTDGGGGEFLLLDKSGVLFTGPARQRLLVAGLLKVLAVNLSFGGTLSSDQFVVRVSNPAGSGVHIFIGSLRINTDQTQEFRIIRDSTLATPTVRPDACRNLNLAASNATQAVVDSDVTEPVDGDNWPGRYRVVSDPGSFEIVNGDGAPIVVMPPGTALTLAGSSSASQVTGAQITIAEVPV